MLQLNPTHAPPLLTKLKQRRAVPPHARARYFGADDVESAQYTPAEKPWPHHKDFIKFPSPPKPERVGRPERTVDERRKCRRCNDHPGCCHCLPPRPPIPISRPHAAVHPVELVIDEDEAQTCPLCGASSRSRELLIHHTKLIHGLSSLSMRRRRIFTEDELLMANFEGQNPYPDLVSPNTTNMFRTVGPSAARRQTLQRIATFNVRGIVRCEQRLQLVSWATLHDLDFCAVQETWLWGVGMCALATPNNDTNRWHLLASGKLKPTNGAATRSSGVALLVSPRWMQHLLEWHAIDDRLMWASFSSSRGTVSVVVCYAPHDGLPDNTKDEFYAKLHGVLNGLHGAMKFVLGDFNAPLHPHPPLIGTSLNRWQPAARSDNAERLITLGLAAVDSFFCQPVPSFCGPQDRKAFLDHILVPPKQRRAVREVWVHPNCPLDSDHAPVIAEIQKVYAKKQQPKPGPPAVNAAFLRLGGATRMPYKATQLPKNATPDQMYRTLVSDLHAFYEDLPKPGNPATPWIRQQTLDTIQMADERINYLRFLRADDPMIARLKREAAGLRARAKILAHQDLEAWWRAEASYLDQYSHDSNCHWLHKRLEQYRAPLLREPPNTIPPVRWTTHFGALFNVVRDVSRVVIPTAPPNPTATRMSDDPPSRMEFDIALNSLKNYKSGAADKVVAEVLKYGPPGIQNQLFELVSRCMTTHTVPDGFRTAALLPHYKGKGSRLDCGDYRGLSLLPVAGKVLARVIKNRLQPYLETQLHETQAGFRSGRGVVDQVFAVQQIQRASRKRGATLAMAFIDIEKAYDSVDRGMLFSLLHAYGVAPGIIETIKAMYCGSKAFVTGGKEDGPPFELTTGVRQGCLLSCLLFDVVMDAITRSFLEKCGSSGVRINGETIALLLYADDVVLFSHDPVDLYRMLALWDQVSFDYGLVVSAKKTKVMFMNPPAALPQPMQLRGAVIEEVKQFRYLGVQITSDGSSDAELSARTASAHHAWSKYKYTVFLNKHLSLRTKVMMFKVTIVTCLLYCAETWAPTELQKAKLTVVYNRYLRQMLGVQPWQNRSTDEVLSIARLPPFERYIASRCTRWYGHVQRMGPERIPKILVDRPYPLHADPTLDAPLGPMVARHVKTWAKHLTWSIDQSVKYFPRPMVPFPQDIVADRESWRTFTAPNDGGTSWDLVERQRFFAQFYARSARVRRPTGPGDRWPMNARDQLPAS